jgi:hypothetical protein
VTKGLQEIHLDKHIRLLDSPGIVFASGEGAAAAALRNAIKVGVWEQQGVSALVPCTAHSTDLGCCWKRHAAWPGEAVGAQSALQQSVLQPASLTE